MYVVCTFAPNPEVWPPCGHVRGARGASIGISHYSLLAVNTLIEFRENKLLPKILKKDVHLWCNLFSNAVEVMGAMRRASRRGAGTHGDVQDQDP